SSSKVRRSSCRCLSRCSRSSRWREADGPTGLSAGHLPRRPSMLVRSSRILPWLMAAGLALGMTACASTDGARGTPEFQATGEVLSTRGTSVAFNDDRILGPEINLTRRTDGSWAGTINDTLVDIRVKEGNLHGIHI